MSDDEREEVEDQKEEKEEKEEGGKNEWEWKNERERFFPYQDWSNIF